MVVRCICRVFHPSYSTSCTMGRKYIPVIITTILTLPYCVYAFVEFANESILSPLQMLLWALIGIVLTVLSLLSAFLLMNRFQKWLNKH